MTDDNEEIKIDTSALMVGEAAFQVLLSLLEAVPIPIDHTDLESQRRVQKLTESVQYFGNLLMAMGSEMVKPKSPTEAKGGSGIILPGM